MIPAGYISSNIDDLSNLLSFMLNKTVTSSGDTIISASNYAELIGDGLEGYAMGWNRFTFNSVDVVDHTGLNENFNSSISFFPDLDLGYVILCNVNSLEFCAQVDKNLRLMIAGAPVPVYRHAARIIRWMSFFIPFGLFLYLIANYARWKKYGFKFGFVAKIIPNLRLLTGIFTSILVLIAISFSFEMFIPTILRSQPDIGWGVLVTVFLGIMNAMVRYFGTVGKIRELKSDCKTHLGPL
jgi:hypothetical protein